MQRVRKIIESDDLIVLQVDKDAGERGSNAMYLLDYTEYGAVELDTAVGRAVRERVDAMLAEPPKTREEPIDGPTRAG